MKAGESWEAIQENINRAAQWFQTDPTQLLMPHCVHGNQVMMVESPFSYDERPKLDALITVKKKYVVGVATADCVPVLCVDPDIGIIAAIHAGWRGALQGILEQTIANMEIHGAQRQKILVAIGPAIQQESYEVGQEVYQKFLKVNQSFKAFFKPNSHNSLQFDLPGLVYYLLKKTGVGEIDWLKIDTYQNPDLFYSCRRSAHQGLKIFGDMLAGIMLKDEA